ncbi:winged helix-turn-helix transcriptional regulator [Actinophytocola glycyrrhizae]|uniref:Winged helix-turn-helix transcriptional regulator n=1 Tax=Actinophytocola glycyrrhizae TaxID=2044873 RepID=A0ABV9S5L7_9PSEU
MTESNWKVVVDSDRLTISSDAFTFTTNGMDPLQLETVVADLQSAVRGTYGQYCGLAQAAEMVGERWGFLIVRDLLAGPKSAAELHAGLPKLSVKLLSRRLNELEYTGVVRPAADADDQGEERYELTEYGRAAEDAVLSFGRWGAAALAKPRPDDIVTDASLTIALRAMFVAEAARDVHTSYEVHIGGHVLHLHIDDGTLKVGLGPLPGADSVLRLGVALQGLVTGQTTVADVLSSGAVSIEGDPELFTDFVTMFQLPRIPSPKVHV